MQKRKPGFAGRLIKTVVSIVFAVVIIVAMVLINPQLQTNKIISAVMGYNHQSVHNPSGVDAKQAEYYKADYTKENIRKAENKLYQQIAGEGVVLLKNDNGILPLKAGSKLSFFGANSKDSDGTTRAFLGGGATKVTLQSAFTKAGFEVNQKLWDFYTTGAGKSYGLAPGSVNYGDAEDFKINEAPLSVLQQESGLLDSAKGTTPVFVLSRVVGEGRDMPRSMVNHAQSQEDKERSYIELDSTERELLQYLNDNFDNVVVLIKSSAAMQVDWLKDYPSVHAIVYSQNVTDALAGVFAGTVNPSGRVVDTFAKDALQSPAAQNFGSYSYTDANGKKTKYNYVDYAEGIYVGYKYYETRYEDAVLGQGNAGDYNYADAVVYPFGYGLSYTTFDWSGLKLTQQGNDFIASVQVTNTGKVAGKDVVQLYAQAPYTQYDRDNGVEKAAVNLVGYAKTKELKPGESEQVSVTIPRDQLKSYDSHKAKTYILEAGDYYFAAAHNAHEAINNMLAAKGSSSDNAFGVARADLVQSWKYATDQANGVDVTTYAVDAQTKTAISNLFDAANDPEVTYLTRNDWTGTFPKHYGEPLDEINTWGNEINCTDKDGNKSSCTYAKPASAKLLKQLEGNSSGTDVDKKSITDKPVFGAKNGLKLSELRGADFDDPKWEKLLDQLTEDDYNQLIIRSGYGVDYVKSVEKPFQTDADAAFGWFYGGTGFVFPKVMMLAQTFNTDLATQLGEMIGNEALLGGANGWYAPAMNIHRTPFSGRNGEYYSEDPFLSGTVASLEIKGAATKGVYSYIKHFALNDQENHRGDRPGNFSVATWSNEQAIRETYVKPFEMCTKMGTLPLKYLEKNSDGTYTEKTGEVPVSLGVMTSFNRIGATWTGGSYALIQKLLRDEWGFKGTVITDNANTAVFMSPYQMIEAGADIKLLNAPQDPTGEQLNMKDPATYHYARAAMHRLMYTVVNSNAMNHAAPGASFKFYNQLKVIQIVFNAVCGVLLALLAFFSIWRWLPATVSRVNARKSAKKARKAAKKANKKTAKESK